MSRRFVKIAAALLVGAGLLGAAPAPDYDIVIRGGRLLDGAGNPWVKGDVAIKDGRIARIGDVLGKGRQEIDASGRYVSPGFIDMMDQSGDVLPKSGGAENKLRMGVTTLFGGEGGFPVEAAEIARYLDGLEKTGIAVNFGSYYNAGQPRVKVMGDGAGTPSAAQLEAMKAETALAMRNGAFGISTALIYPPNTFQSTDEIVALASVAGKCGGFYASHMRDESAKLIAAIDEAIAIGERSGAKVEIFHLKAAFRPLAGKLMPQAVARIAAARARGVDIAADLYPYTAGGTGLEITAPSWVYAEGMEAGFAKLRDPRQRERMKRELAAGSQPGWSNLVEAAGGWDHVVLANAHDPAMAKFHGQSLAAIGKALNRDPADVAWDITLKALPNRAMALYFMMDERDIELAIKQPWVSIGTDAGSAAKFGEVDTLGLPHPRAYGTFPRILAEYVRKRGVLTLEDAVRKMTSWPAQRMGLTDRGVLREGLRADITIFDAGRIEEGATWDKPVAAPSGIDDVIVNGVAVLRAGKATGARPGMALRHRCE
jgi:N-acyl-D-amino-acid deacylase